MSDHEIQDRVRRQDGTGASIDIITCTCGQTFSSVVSLSVAGVKWLTHRDELGRKPPLADRFADFHQAHPSVYVALVRLTRQAHAAGAKRVGIGQLFEVLRWEWILSALPAADEAWKLNNSYRSRYARLIMQNEPWAADLFETRRLTT